MSAVSYELFEVAVIWNMYIWYMYQLRLLYTNIVTVFDMDTADYLIKCVTANNPFTFMQPLRSGNFINTVRNVALRRNKRQRKAQRYIRYRTLLATVTPAIINERFVYDLLPIKRLYAEQMRSKFVKPAVIQFVVGCTFLRPSATQNELVGIENA